MTRPAARPLTPAFYVRAGTGARRDLLALLHLPYTAWHLAFVVIGAALAPTIAIDRLAGTLAAFFLGTGIAAHALDEWNGRPLRTGVSDAVLLGAAGAALSGILVLSLLGAALVSPWVAVWAAAGIALAVGYAVEVPRWLHTDPGFALAWGAFPVLGGYWVQAEGISAAAVLVAASMTLLSLAQRTLSTAARRVRRRSPSAAVLLSSAPEDEDARHRALLDSWESPLLLLAATTLTLAAGLIAARAGW
jgi:hypothetical protein